MVAVTVAERAETEVPDDETDDDGEKRTKLYVIEMSMRR